MDTLLRIRKQVIDALEPPGNWIALLPIRLLMGYEFYKAGIGKFRASDSWYGDAPSWFVGSVDKFPFPVSLLSADMNWFMVTWLEILGGLALFLGLFTRFWAFSLLVVTVVAIAGVHWPEDWNSLAELWKGYAVSNKGFGNFRIPLLFAAMLFPLIFLGAGKLSLDSLISKRFS